MKSKLITKKLTLEEYNKKYRNRNYKLLKHTKKEIEEFDKKNNSTSNLLLRGRKWVLIKDTYYEIPRPIRFTWFRNLNAGVQVATVVVLGGLIATAAVLPPVLHNMFSFNGVVTEEGWKSALENIVNISEKRNLNYTTKSHTTIQMYSSDGSNGDKVEIRDLVVQGDLEECIDSEGKRVYMYNYHNLPLRYTEGDTSARAFECMMRDYISYAFGNFYDSFNDGFTFDEKTKSYVYTAKQSEEYQPVRDISTTVKFDSPNTIKKITSSYSVYSGDTKKEDVSADYEYTFGNANLQPWDKESQTILAAHTKSLGHDIGIGGNIATVTSISGFTNEEPFIIDLGNPQFVGFSEFRLYDQNNAMIYFWPRGLKIYNNSYLLERDTDWKYIYDDRKPMPRVEGFKLLTPIKATDKITVKVAIDNAYITNADHINITKPAA